MVRRNCATGVPDMVSGRHPGESRLHALEVSVPIGVILKIFPRPLAQP